MNPHAWRSAFNVTLAASLLLASGTPRAAAQAGAAAPPADPALPAVQADPPAAPAPPVWPDTAAGRAARGFIDLFNGGPVPTVEYGDGFIGPRDVLFTPDLLAQIPIERIDEWSNARRMHFGELKLHSIKGEAPNAIAVLVQGSGDGSGWLAQVEIEPEFPNRITRWRFVASAEATRLTDISSWTDLGAMFDAFAAKQGLEYSLAVVEVPVHTGFPGGSATLARLGADRRLNISTAIRWFVLDAITQKVKAKEERWNEVNIVPDSARSLPITEFGATEGEISAPIVDLVLRMSRDSDNTACDGIMEIVGRDAVLASLAARTGDDPRNRPLLSTMENYRLKVGLDGKVIEDFLAGDEAAQEGLTVSRIPTNEISMPLASAWRIPQHIGEVGWFATAEDLARLLGDLWLTQGDATLAPVMQALTANAKMPHPDPVWATQYFRPGIGEPGVVWAYWLLQKPEGPRYVVTIVLNDKDQTIPIEPLDPMFVSMLRYIASLGGPGPADDPAAGAAPTP